VGHNILFSDYLESDQRTPCFTFSVPESILSLFHVDISGGNEFGLLAPRIEFYLGLLMTLLIGAIFNACVSCIIYQFMVIPRKIQQKSKQDSQTLLPFLIGFGIIMPLCIVSPYYAVRYFCIKNKILKFLAAVAQAITFFRTSEAMFGFLPSSVEDSLRNLIIYNALPVEVKFNNGVIRTAWSDVFYYFVHWIKYILILGMVSSYLQAHDYELYPNNEGPMLQDIRLSTGFSRNQMINNLATAAMFQTYLTTFGNGLNFLTSLCGVEQIPMMLNPVFESSSPSDFWGRRWNLVVHGVLKRGVHKPVRAKYSRLTATVATFFASGIFHEWVLSVVFYPDSEEHTGSCFPPYCYTPGYGRNSLFFVWNGILIGLEYVIGGAVIFQLCKKHLPVTAVSLLVASTALPMAHWFSNDYIRTDFFNDSQIGFPIVVRVIY